MVPSRSPLWHADAVGGRPPHQLAVPTVRTVRIFPDEKSILRLIGAVLLEQNDEWQLQHRYMQVEAMAELMAPAEPEPALIPPQAA